MVAERLGVAIADNMNVACGNDILTMYAYGVRTFFWKVALMVLEETVRIDICDSVKSLAA